MINKKNLNSCIAALKRSDINPCLQIAILCVVGKESGFKWRSERSYKNTSVKRIREIFPGPFANRSDDDIKKLKQNDMHFFHVVYGYRLGNRAFGDGWRYRGRGPNQLTGRANYKQYSTPDIDLINHPELANDPTVAAHILVKFFTDQLARHGCTMEKRYGDIADPSVCLWTIANINAGAGRGVKNAHVIRAAYNASKWWDKMSHTYNAA